MLTVEIHDVSPATRDEIEIIQAALARMGLERPTLLVVPSLEDEQGRRWDLRRHPRFVRWLRERQEAGCEVVQHGFSHRAPGLPPPGLRNRLMHHWFSRGCAEFAHLTGDEATERLLAGRQILRDCGLSTQGFIAPAWQQSRESVGVLARLGYRFTAFLTHVLPLVGRRRSLRTPALTFDAPGPLVDHPKRLLMRGIEALARSVSLLRVALHPADVGGARPLEHILERIRSLLCRRRQTSYSGWLVRLAAGGAP